MKTNARKEIGWAGWLVLCLTPLCLLAAANAAGVINFNGQDLSGWRKPVGLWTVVQGVKLSAADPKEFAFEDGQGVMVNGRNKVTSNILSEFEHGDVEAHIEFCVPKNSNSGVYFMGRYEIQVFDSWGVEKPKHSDCGGIYERWKDDQGYEGHAPRVNASKAPGEWQTLDVKFLAPKFNAAGQKIQNARFIKVTLNGQVVHENVEVTGPTRAAAYENAPEKSLGPLMLQGDHGPVAYRNIRLMPLIRPRAATGLKPVGFN